MSRRASAIPTRFSNIQEAAQLEGNRGWLLAECAAALYWAAFADLLAEVRRMDGKKNSDT
jgi:hypothetical protein